MGSPTVAAAAPHAPATTLAWDGSGSQADLMLRDQVIAVTPDDAATGGTSSARVDAFIVDQDFDTAGAGVITWATQPTRDSFITSRCPQATAGGAPTTLQAEDKVASDVSCDVISNRIGGGTWLPAPASTYYGIVIMVHAAGVVAGGDVYVEQAAPTVEILPMP